MEEIRITIRKKILKIKRIINQMKHLQKKKLKIQKREKAQLKISSIMIIQKKVLHLNY